MPKRQSKITINNNQGNMVSPEPTCTPPKTPKQSELEEIVEKAVKTNLMKIIETLKVEMNKTIKANEENTKKGMEETNNFVKEAQESATKQIEEMKESQEKANKQVKETIQDLKKEIEAIKKTQTEIIMEMKNLEKQAGSVEASYSNRIQEMEERISGVEDSIDDIDTSVKENIKSKKVLTQNVQELWDTMKRPNLRIIGIEEGEDLQLKGPENIFNKIIEENFPNLKKELPIKVLEAYRTPNKLDQKRKSPRHIIIKTLSIQNKERILRASREKQQVTYKGKPIRITPDFSMETLKARRAWTEILQTLREHRCQARLLYPAKLSITIDGENKIFHDKAKFEQYLSTNPALQKVLEGKIHPKEANYTQNNTGNNSTPQ